MPGLEDMIKAAEKSLGLSGRPNYITNWYGDRNGSYFRNAPWCQMSITYWAHQTGNYDAVCFGKDYAYTVWHAQEFQRRGQWHVDTAGIRRGDIVFFDWAGTNSIGHIDHVGIVTDVNGRDVLTIEGNTENKCLRRVRSAATIVGYGRPVYATPVPAPAPTPKPEPKPVPTPTDEPAHDYTKVSYGGKTVNVRTREMLKDAVGLLTEYSWTPVLTQGSYNTGVGASAGTHDGGGVVDIRTSTMTDNGANLCVKALRKAGFAAWLRTPSEGFSKHIHAVAIGDKQMSPSAAKQVVQYFEGKNGLANHGPDSAPASVGRPYPAWAAAYAPGAAPAPTPPPPVPPTPPPYAPPAFPTGLRPNSSSPSAKPLQRALKKAGYMSNSVTLADNYGPLTQAAVIRFHDANPQYAETPGDPAIGPQGWADLHREAYG